MTASSRQVITLAALAALWAGCSGRARRTPDDTIVVLVEARFTSIDPRYTNSADDVKLSRLVAPGLTSVETETLEPKLLLAQSIEQKGERTVDVTLRPDLRFSDGTPLSAADVVFTYRTALDPAMESPMLRHMRDRFTGVEALDRRRVRFHLREPLATIMTDLDFGIVSERAAGADRRFAGERVVGAGPYWIESYHPEDVRLGRNPHWPFATPRTERMRVRVVRDANARALMLVGGSADLTTNSIRVDLVDDLVDSPRVALATSPGTKLTYIMMNGRDPALRDARVRRAIAHAIDREQVLTTKLGGRAVLATGLLPPGHWAHNADVEIYRHDPAAARRLLDQAGYPDPDGPGGRPRLRLSFKTSSDQLRVALARVWAAQLARVGIAVDVQSFEFNTVFADFKSGNYQLGSMQTATITEPDWLLAYFNSERIPSREDPNAQNRWRYASTRVDELTERGRHTLDREARRALYAEAQAILARDLPIIPLWHEQNLAVMNVELRGFALTRGASLYGLLPASKVTPPPRAARSGADARPRSSDPAWASADRGEPGAAGR
jgi:peptide/nickel transport system substrate-binding protein